jgi:hypothetical protein
MRSNPKTRKQTGREVLRSQKRSPEKAPLPPKQTQIETLTLASGETRSVAIEMTNDKEWNDLAALTEGGTALSLDQKDFTHRTIAAIAALRVKHEGHWKQYCEDRSLKWRKEAKSEFQCVVMWVLNRMKTATDENHTSKASMIAGCLDEYWEIQRSEGMKPDEMVAWLNKMGGYTKVYRERLDRLREPNNNKAERYHRYLKLPPLEERDIPEWLDGFDGEVVLSVQIDRHARRMKCRSVWQPKGSSFWYGNALGQFIAARPEYGEAVEPARPAAAETPVDSAGEREDTGTNATDEANENRPTDIDPVPVGNSDGFASAGEEPLISETSATSGSIETNFDANQADLTSTQIATESETAGDVAIGSDTLSACKFPDGCRYGGCKGQGRCLAQQTENQTEPQSAHAE